MSSTSSPSNEAVALASCKLRSSYGNVGWSLVTDNLKSLQSVLTPEGYPMHEACNGYRYQFSLVLKHPYALHSLESSLCMHAVSIQLASDDDEDEGTQMCITYSQCGTRVDLSRFTSGQMGALLATRIDVEFSELSKGTPVSLCLNPFPALQLAPLESALASFCTEKDETLVLKCSDGEVRVNPILAMACSAILYDHIQGPRPALLPVEHTAKHSVKAVQRLKGIMASRKMPSDITADEVELMHMLRMDPSCLNTAWTALQENVSPENCLEVVNVAHAHSNEETLSVGMSCLKANLQMFHVKDSKALLQALALQ